MHHFQASDTFRLKGKLKVAHRLVDYWWFDSFCEVQWTDYTAIVYDQLSCWPVEGNRELKQIQRSVSCSSCSDGVHSTVSASLPPSFLPAFLRSAGGGVEEHVHRC